MTETDYMPLILDRLSHFLGRPVEQADLDAGYDSLGADSMDMVALAFELEKARGIPVMPEIFLQHETIAAALEQILKSDTPAVE